MGNESVKKQLTGAAATSQEDEYGRVDRILRKQYRWQEKQRPKPEEWELLLLCMDAGYLYCRHFIFYWEPKHART